MRWSKLTTYPLRRYRPNFLLANFSFAAGAISSVQGVHTVRYNTVQLAGTIAFLWAALFYGVRFDGQSSATPPCPQQPIFFSPQLLHREFIMASD